MNASAMSITIQRRILAMLDEGSTYEQITTELHICSTQISRVMNRHQAWVDGLVDTPWVGQPMNVSGRSYIPTPEQIEARLEIVRARHIEKPNNDDYMPRVVGLRELGIWVHGGARS